MQRDRIQPILLIIWIISAITDCIIYLPILHYKLQLFEVLFCYFLFTSAGFLWRYINKPLPLRGPLLAFIGLALLNIIFHFESQVMLENLGTLYSCLIPFVVSGALLQIKAPDKVIEKSLLGMAVLLPICCLVGWLFYQFGWTSSMIKVYGQYPYLGTIVRVVGLTNSPNKVVAFAAMAIFFLWYVQPRMSQFTRIGLISALLITCIFTYSKEIVIIPIVVGLIWLYERTEYRFVPRSVLCASAVLITVLTYFYISSDHTPPQRQDIIHSEAAISVSDLTIYPTSYYFLFSSSLQMIKEHPLTGVGFGNYIGTVEEHQQLGLYPKSLYSYEAHDNYAGLVAQYGVGYIFVLFWLVFSLRKMTYSLDQPKRQFVTATLLFFMLFGCIYFSYHMRLMWLFFGIVQYYALASHTSGKQEDYG